MRYHLPYAARGQTIGLLGGSFDPAHEGHAHITRVAMARFGLDRMWWLISPQNPLKAHGPADMARRMAAARAVMGHPRVDLSDVEHHIQTRFTVETIAELQRLYPTVRFVWIMGADNLAQFHRWKAWQEIAARLPIGVIARPGERLRGRCSKAMRVLRHARVPSAASHTLGARAAPAVCFINAPMRGESSSEIRARGGWPRRDDG